MATAGRRKRSTVDLQPSGGPIEAAILFCDLVSSSEFASVMSLQKYAEYVASFEDVCAQQCKHFFEDYCRDYQPGDYQYKLIGDELAVFVHSGTGATDHAEDVYQLICLAQALKCAWLGSPVNEDRIDQGAPSVELAIGIHAGQLWAVPCGQPAPVLRGFVINVAKRVETHSREGQHFRIMISGAAFKRVNRSIRSLLIGPKDVARMKGIVMSVAIHEVIDSFIDPTDRMYPEARAKFRRVAEGAMRCNSFDVWIHSCHQLMEATRLNVVTNDNLELCKGVLNLEPYNGVALFFAAQAYMDLGNHATAMLYLTDLTHRWPTFTDGWLEMAKSAIVLDERKIASHAVRQARRHGAGPAELPKCPWETTPAATEA